MFVPDLFTVAEAAAILRVGRTTAYELAARDVATGGGEGLGVVRIGNQLRVRRAALEVLLGGPAVGDSDSALSSCDSPSLPFGS